MDRRGRASVGLAAETDGRLNLITSQVEGHLNQKANDKNESYFNAAASVFALR